MRIKHNSREALDILQGLARTLTGLYKLVVRWGPSRTDGQMIWVHQDPWFFSAHKLSEAAKLRCKRATTAHEAFHVLWTQFDAWRQYQAEPVLRRRFHPEVIRLFGNAAEDARIELLGANAFPGTLEWLQLHNLLAVKGMEVPSEPVAALLQGVIARQVAGILPPGFAQQWPRWVKLLDDLAPLMEGARRARTTADCLAIAHRMLEQAEPHLPAPQYSPADDLARGPSDMKEGLKGRPAEGDPGPLDPRVPVKKRRQKPKPTVSAGEDSAGEQPSPPATGPNQLEPKGPDEAKADQPQQPDQQPGESAEAQAGAGEPAEADETETPEDADQAQEGGRPEPESSEPEDAGTGGGPEDEDDRAEGFAAGDAGGPSPCGEKDDAGQASGSGETGGEDEPAQGGDRDDEGPDAAATEDGSAPDAGEEEPEDEGDDVSYPNPGEMPFDPECGDDEDDLPDSDSDEDYGEAWGHGDPQPKSGYGESFGEEPGGGYGATDGDPEDQEIDEDAVLERLVASAEAEEAEAAAAFADDGADVEAEAEEYLSTGELAARGRDVSRAHGCHTNAALRIEEARPHPALHGEVMVQTADLRHELHRMLKPLIQREHTDLLTGRRRGALDVGRLWRVNTLGDPHVFRKRHVPYDPAMAVYILGDGSGSMASKMSYGGRQLARVDAVRLAITAFCEVLQELRIVHAASMFRAAGASPTGEVFHRRLLRFGQHSRRESVVDFDADNSNRDGYSIRLAREELKARPEELKLLLVLSDGQPASWGGYGCTDLNDLGIVDTADAIREARDAGIETLGFYFGERDAAAVAKEVVMFGREGLVVVDNLEDLPYQMAGLLRQVGRRHRIA